MNDADRVRELEATLAKIDALQFDSADKSRWEHNDRCRGGEPTCPGCWADDIRSTLHDHRRRMPETEPERLCTDKLCPSWPLHHTRRMCQMSDGDSELGWPDLAAMHNEIAQRHDR